MLKETCFSCLDKIRKENPNARFIAVSRTIPKGVIIDRWMSLAPSYYLLNEYKNLKLNQEQYIEIFKEEIGNSKQAQKDMKVIKALSEKGDIFLVCWEKTGFCHRHLLIEMISGKKGVKQATLGV